VREPFLLALLRAGALPSAIVLTNLGTSVQLVRSRTPIEIAGCALQQPTPSKDILVQEGGPAGADALERIAADAASKLSPKAAVTVSVELEVPLSAR
jgi:hypothetical protein